MNSSHTQTVVVTGATSGVGRATAVRFAEHGARVALLARGSDGLEATARQVEKAGGTALPIATDVSDPDAVAETARRTEETLGEIDIWVNNAMTTVFSFFEDTQPEEFRRATEVTYLGVVWGTRTALQHMRPRDRGTIIQVGSALAYRGIPLQSVYCGSKHAIKGFTESVRTELGHARSNIHVGMVQLPAVNTPQFSHCRSRSSTAIRCRFLPSTSRKWLLRRSSWRSTSTVERSTSDCPPSLRSSVTRSRPA